MSNKVADKAGYVALSGIFNIILAIFCWRRRPDQIGMRDWGLLALATFRLSRMLAYDKVMEAYRSPVVETVPHDSGAGLTTQAHSDATGFKKAMGEMISCPVCNGTWISAGLVYGMCFAPNLTRTLLMIMSAVGASEIMQAAFEKLQWEGELARHRAGEQMRINRAVTQGEQAPAVAPELRLRKRA
jgi:hypothetical protein